MTTIQIKVFPKIDIACRSIDIDLIDLELTTANLIFQVTYRNQSNMILDKVIINIPVYVISNGGNIVNNIKNYVITQLQLEENI